MRIEDYALVGDLHTAALIGRDGSVDWLCLPRFDSGSCFAALLGDEQNGRWLIAPAGEVREVRRRYRDQTLVLETEFDTPSGTVRVVDAMPPRDEVPGLVRLVECTAGEVAMTMRWALRFVYGSAAPWVRRVEDADGSIVLVAVAGPDAVCLRGDVLPRPRGEEKVHEARFTLRAGESTAFSMQWMPSTDPVPPATDVRRKLADTYAWWQDWSARSTYTGPHPAVVQRSLITLKALTYRPTGGIVAAPTTSLPEDFGGERNWDYRYCWLRDATLTLWALLGAGYHDSARDWRDWLLRAIAGDPADLQIVYGAAGERLLPEIELSWLAGYEKSTPVRLGNEAAQQFQLDVYGEVMDALHHARVDGVVENDFSWSLQCALMGFLEDNWQRPDRGLWEVRGPERHFTHSRVMVWVAFDRAVRGVEEFGLDGPAQRWRELRDQVHAEVCEQGWNATVGAFTQYYGGTALDASVLMIPLVGFLPPDDERVVATLSAIERGLKHGDLVYRYDAREGGDGLKGGEATFLACSFWYVDALARTGRQDEAAAMFDRLVALRNDVGLLAEEYDPVAKRMAGNFPQAFSHLALVNSAHTLAGNGCPRHLRPSTERSSS